MRAGRVVDLGLSCRSQAELDAWAAGTGRQGAAVAPLGFILKADGVSGRTLTDASWTGGVDGDYSVNESERAVYPLSSTAHRAYPSRASHSTSAAGEAACYMAVPRNAWGGSVL